MVLYMSHMFMTCCSVFSGEFQCGFEEEALCLFSQDKADEFDWTRHRTASRDAKSTPNTGPSLDRTGSKQGRKTRCHITSHKENIHDLSCDPDFPSCDSGFLSRRFLHVHRDIEAEAGG